MSEMLDAALAYAARGWPVFPVQVRAKRPLTAHGFQDATTDATQIRAWWERWPEANLGIPTGLDTTFDVLDVDPPHGEESLRALEAKHGELPPGPQQRTARGGRHLLFRGGSLGRCSVRALGRDLDVRSRGGYVVVDPSIGESGTRYVFEDLDEPLPLPPPWLAGAASEPSPAAPPARGGLREGSRNDTLFRLASSMRGHGMSPEAILAALHADNAARCAPPLAPREVEQIARSASRYPSGDPEASEPVQVVFDAGAEPPHERVLALGSNERRFARALARQDPRLADFGRRAVFLCATAYRAGWSDQETADLLAAHARTSGQELSAEAAVETLERARRAGRGREELLRAIGRQEDEVEAQEVRRVAEEETDPEVVLRLLTERLGVPVTGAEKHGEKDPTFFLEVGGTLVKIGKVAQLLSSNTTVRQAVSLATDGRAIPRKLSGATWDVLAGAILRISVYRDAGEAEEGRHLEDRVARYCEEQRVADCASLLAPPVDVVEHSGSFRWRGRLYLSNESLCRWVNAEAGERTSARAMAPLLRETGWIPERVQVWTAEDSRQGRRNIQRTYWWRAERTRGE